VVANQAKSNLDLSAIIKQGLMPSDTESFLTDLEWLRMARFYYPIMTFTRPLNLCLFLSDYQILFDYIVITLLHKSENKRAKAILKNLNKYVASDTLYKAAKLTKKRIHHCSDSKENLLYGSPKLYSWVKSFIETINAHSTEFDPLFIKYLFASSSSQ
jgi:hypothetical protein